MTVYIVKTGENGEGGRIISVHKSRDTALSTAKAYAKNRSEAYTKRLGEGWELVRCPSESNSSIIAFWTYGCDFVSVTVHAVVEN